MEEQQVLDMMPVR